LLLSLICPNFAEGDYSCSIDTVATFAKTGLITNATTNPLFVSQAGSNEDARYEAMVMEAVAYAKTKTCSQDGCDLPDETLNMAVDQLAVNLGKELVGLIDGRISTEIDIRLSYDTNASVERGTCRGFAGCVFCSSNLKPDYLTSFAQLDPSLQCTKRWVCQKIEYSLNLLVLGKVCTVILCLLCKQCLIPQLSKSFFATRYSSC
jgi:hypothetical protein